MNVLIKYMMFVSCRHLYFNRLKKLFAIFVSTIKQMLTAACEQSESMFGELGWYPQAYSDNIMHIVRERPPDILGG